jgi:hypothetical protein
MSQAGFFLPGGGGSAIVETLTGNTGGAVGPTGNNINVVGAGQVYVTGDPGDSTLTITSQFPYTDESAGFSALSNNGYFVTGTTTATLPPSPAQGDRIEFIVYDSFPLTVQANTGQAITIGVDTSVTGGVAASNQNGCAVAFVYRAADSEWFAISVVGTWTVT